MSDFLSKWRHLAHSDFKTVLQRWRLIRLSRGQLLETMEKLSEVFAVLASLLLLYALLLWFWPGSSSLDVEENDKPYHFSQLATNKMRTLSSFEAQGLEGKDPLWLELHEQLELVAINGRGDSPGSGLAKFRFLTTGAELKAQVNQNLYFSLSATNGQWLRVEKSKSAQIAFKVTKISLDNSLAKVDMEIFHPKQVSENAPVTWAFVENLTLRLEIPKKQAEVQSLQVLTRSGCRWWGPDMFLLHHSDAKSRDRVMTQRLEIGLANKKQILFVGPGYGIIHPGQDFVSVPLGTATQGQPLWLIDDIVDEKLQIIGWNLIGDQNIRLSLPKQQESWQPQTIESQVQLAGVRGGDHLLVQIQQERWNLKVLDWLFRTPKGWEKIRSAEQVDDYVSGKLTGELLILRDMRQDPESQNWLAHFRIYSPARSRIHDFEVKVSQAAGLSFPQEPEGPTLEQIRDPHSNFIPLPHKEAEMPKWPANEERAWEPPTEISPEKMLELLRGLSEQGAQSGEAEDPKPASPVKK